jgi:hypothetical protein
MGLISTSIPNLINGISQQNAVQRNVGQAETQTNFSSNIIEGLTKRPPTEFVANLLSSTAFPNNAAVHWINRDSANQYVAVFTNGTVKVFNLDGVEKTVTIDTGGASYLATTAPINDLAFTNIADYTFVANKTKTITETSATTAAKVQEYISYVKSSQYGRQYSVTLNHSTWSYPIEVLFQMPTGNDASTDSGFRDTEKIAHILLYGTASSHWSSGADGIGFKTIRTDTGATLSTSEGLANYSGITGTFTHTQYGNTIYGTCSSGTFAVETTDGFGNQAMYAVKDAIQDFTDLPYYAKPGMILQITGEEGDTLSDYYVEFKANGVWSECVGPGVKLGLDNATMPYALINNNNNTFSFTQQTYTNRASGDDVTNSAPSFVGKKVSNLTFFQNRLGIISDQNLVLSENASYYNFYATTGTDVLDTDPVDIAAAGTTVNKLYNSIDFNEQLLLFSEEAQYILESSGDSVTPTTAVLTKTSTFSHATKVSPVSAGKYVYFAQNRNDKTAVTEYFADDDTLTNDGIDVTIGVSSLIPGNAYKIVSNNIEDTMVVLCHDTLDGTNNTAYTPSSAVTATNASTLNIYKYFWDSNKKVQSAWSTWSLSNCQIISAEAYDSYLYVLVNENTNTKLLKIDLRNPDFSALSHNIHVDFRTATLSGTYNSSTDLTTFTLPYSLNQTLKAVDATNGSNLTIDNSSSGTTQKIKGNHTSVVFGSTYLSEYKFSTPYVREDGGSGTISVTSGRYQIRQVSVDYQNSGFFQAVVTQEGRNNVTYEFNGTIINSASAIIGQPNITSGTYNIPIQSRNTNYTCTLKSDSHLPVHFVSAELEGFYHRRSQRA